MSVDLTAFRVKVLAEGQTHYRDLPWRNTHDPYHIWISEVMLQQTQVSRVDGRWQRWLNRFPSIEALAQADSAEVLDEWQGLGYNRRALSVHKAAQQIVTLPNGFPTQTKELVALPGIGPATAAGIRAFAFELPGVYLETNVRTVFLHEFFPQQEGISDKQIIPLVEKTCPTDASNPQDNPRSWYYALLDYGAYLKKVVPNPSRRSKTHSKQSKFEGSHRQKRAELLRILLEARRLATPMGELELALALNAQEAQAHRPEVEHEEFIKLLTELSREGFCKKTTTGWIA
ncbi:HhH-GPD family protein [Atopobium fossor]|uniref:adenine glycosylase n=1 Tax=Atopobium fossor TaxID=39487 RepID=UPI0005585D93|nr:adenine glycosylase [Atopobium fossor]